MLLEVVLNATVATATAATQAMNSYLSNFSVTAPISPLTSAASAESSTLPCLSCSSSYSDNTSYNWSQSEVGAAEKSESGEGLINSPWVSVLGSVTGAYMSAHGIVSLVTCALGIPMNVLNIWVLTRKHMRTPVNCILTWLAVFDLLTMLSYVPFSLHFYCLSPPKVMSAEKNSLGWMTFIIFHSGFTATTHTISIWLGVTLAMFRYKHIFSPAKGHITRVRRLVRARIAVFVVVVASIVVMIPNYLMNRILQHIKHIRGTNITEVLYFIEDPKLGTPEMKPMTAVNLWMQCILAKFLPSVLMVVYSGLLVRTVRMNVRMMERRRTGARPSESYCSARFSLADQSSDGDSSTAGNHKKNSSGTCGYSGHKQRNNRYQELSKTQEFECGVDSSRKWLVSATENGHTKTGMSQSHSSRLNVERRENYDRKYETVNGGKDDYLCVPDAERKMTLEEHSHDSGIYSNTSHDHLTYDQQCKLNLQQKKNNIDEAKRNNNRVNESANTKSCKNNERRHSLGDPSSFAYNIIPGCNGQQAFQAASPGNKCSPDNRPQRISLQAPMGVCGGETPQSTRKVRASSLAPPAGGSSNSRSQDSARTTRMLLIVITLFLVTELPQGFLIALSVTIPDFFHAVYVPLGDVMDQLALLNNGLNFLLYCSMSRDFRTTLLDRLHTSRLGRHCGRRLCVQRVTSDRGGNANDSTRSSTKCPGFKLKRRKQHQMVPANDV